MTLGRKNSFSSIIYICIYTTIGASLFYGYDSCRKMSGCTVYGCMVAGSWPFLNYSDIFKNSK